MRGKRTVGVGWQSWRTRVREVLREKQVPNMKLAAEAFNVDYGRLTDTIGATGQPSRNPALTLFLWWITGVTPPHAFPAWNVIGAQKRGDLAAVDEDLQGSWHELLSAVYDAESIAIPLDDRGAFDPAFDLLADRLELVADKALAMSTAARMAAEWPDPDPPNQRAHRFRLIQRKIEDALRMADAIRRDATRWRDFEPETSNPQTVLTGAHVGTGLLKGASEVFASLNKASRRLEETEE